MDISICWLKKSCSMLEMSGVFSARRGRCPVYVRLFNTWQVDMDFDKVWYKLGLAMCHTVSGPGEGPRELLNAGSPGNKPRSRLNEEADPPPSSSPFSSTP
ncbi:hypothetical protein M758_9G074300 [Ceratodon purpureus]|nr:hypothetical protein M758_9G074300 [Ceratodon purpureus]